VPQIWDEYSSGEDPEALRLRRRQDFAALLERKKAAQAKARAERQAAGNARSESSTRRSKRAPKRSARGRAMVSMPDTSLITLLTVLQDEEQAIPSEDEVLDAGAIENEDDIYVHSDKTPEPAQANLHPEDPSNFFKLAAFLKIVLAHSITDDDINSAEDLIRSYCTELLHVGKISSVCCVYLSNLLHSCMAKVSYVQIITTLRMYPTACATTVPWLASGLSFLSV
jgi:hypothetical protein